jgi:hypothetical protein
MLWLLSSMLFSVAAAEPYMDPENGWLRIDAAGSFHSRAVRDLDCSGSACSGRWERAASGVEIGAALFRGVGLSASASRARDTIDEASYKGVSTIYEGTLHLAASLYRSFGLAVEVQDPGNGGLLWFGAEAFSESERMLRPMGVEGVSVDLPLVPAIPGSAVVGARLVSQRVGTPWGHSPRLRTSIEARVGADMGVSLGLGAAW